MKLYSIYLLRKIILNFLFVITSLILLIWFAKAMTFLGFVTEKGVNLSEFFSLMVLILPWLLLIIIPISLFLAVLISYNQMIGHNEIIILKSVGLDNLKLAKPAIFLSVICCLFCYYISLYLMPMANKKLHNSRSDFKNNYINLAISPGVFENINSLTIYVKNRKEISNLSGILIYDKRNSEYSATIIAQSGFLEQKTKNNSLLLYLNQGTAQKFNYKTKKTDTLNFDSYVVNLSDNKNDIQNKVKWKANERYLDELLEPEEDSSIKDIKRYYAEIHQRITYPLLSMILTLIAVSTVLTGKFSRYGNLTNIIKVVVEATIFIGLFMMSYNLIEYSKNLTPVIYLNISIFIIISFYLLKSKNV